MLVARSISGGRVNVVGLRLPEEEEQAAPPTRMGSLRRRLSEFWRSVAGSNARSPGLEPAAPDQFSQPRQRQADLRDADEQEPANSASMYGT